MRIGHTPDVEAFREEVRAFLRAEWGPGKAGDWMESDRPKEEEKALVMGFQRKLADRGWLAMAWPKEYGGSGAPHMRQLVYNEEMAYANAPAISMGISWVGPSLMLYGTEEQKERFVPRIANATDWWCTLYSEPIAGSDLAALQTRAVRDGDDFILNGQKIWTSGGHHADWGWLAARTDPDAPKHKGITMFVLDMKTPGISIRPLINMGNRHGFNEVFFENVRIPASQVVGEVNRGWYHMAVALDFERSGIQSYAMGRRSAEAMVRSLKDDPSLVRKRPGIRHEVADRAIEVNTGTFMAYRVATMQAKGMVPNHEASCSKVFGSEMSQRLALTGMHVFGMAGQLTNGSKHQVVDQARAYLAATSATVAAGTSEIQRGIIAQRGLGLPRG